MATKPVSTPSTTTQLAAAPSIQHPLSEGDSAIGVGPNRQPPSALLYEIHSRLDRRFEPILGLNGDHALEIMETLGGCVLDNAVLMDKLAVFLQKNLWGVMSAGRLMRTLALYGSR